MNQRQINKKHMFETLLAYLDANATVWQGVAKIGEIKILLAQIIESITLLAKDQVDAAVSYGKTKLALKDTIAAKADVLNDLVEVYAIIVGDDELARHMGKSESDLFKLKNDDFILQIKVIIESATEYAEPLKEEYGMTDEQVADVQADLDRFLEISGLPRFYQVKSSVATKGLGELMEEASDLVRHKLDNLMKIYKRSNSSFYAGYEKARMIIGN